MKNCLLKLTFSIFVSLTVQTLYCQDVLKLCAQGVQNSNTVELNMVVENFKNVSAYQFGIAWDRTKFEFESVGNFNPKLIGLSENLFSPEEENVPQQVSLIRTLWVSPDATGIQLEDGEVLFTVTLTTKDNGGINDFFGIAPSSDFKIEFADGNANLIDVDVEGDSCQVLYFSNLTSVESDLQNDEFTYFPNPVDDALTISSKTNLNGRLEIINASGNRLLKTDINSFNQSVQNVSDFPPGIYILRFESYDSRKTNISRFIKI